MRGQIEASQLTRRAFVYVRQSTMAQVVHHQESTMMQYELRQRALALGWAPEAIEIIDEDQGNLDNWDPAVLDGLAKEREVILFNNAGVASSSGEVPTTFAGMAKNAEAFIDALGLKPIDLLGFSIGGMVAQQITLDRPELVRKLILVGTAPRNHDAGNGQASMTPETAAIFGATYNPPENQWLKVFFTDSGESQAAGRAFLERYLSRTENRDAPVSDKLAPAQIAAVGEWGTASGERFAYLTDIKQPTLVVSGNHDVIVYTVNSVYLVQSMPNVKLILYPDANHGSWYQITRTSFSRQTVFSPASGLGRDRLAGELPDAKLARIMGRCCSDPREFL